MLTWSAADCCLFMKEFMNDFTQFDLNKVIQSTLAAGSYATPTPIQLQAIPHALAGRDILGIAQTGTGKTAAFSLPSLHRLAEQKKGTKAWQCRMLVLSPTRELASQIADSMVRYGRGLGVFVTTAFGGVPINRQKRALQKGVDVLVATPGRLLDLYDQRSLDLSAVEILVLDEADQMLDLGFREPLRRIAAMLPKKRQSLFFSATMPKSISELASAYLVDPVKVQIAPQSTTAEKVQQIGYFPRGEDKSRLIARILADKEFDRVLVFTRTKHGADRLTKFLENEGHGVAAIHGNKSQPQREKALNAFRKGTIDILIATDIAARGIDVSGVSHVINYELPNVPEQYVHRIGRTARADASGIAISLVGPDERQWLRDIEKLIKMKLDILPLPKGLDKPDIEELPPPVMGGGGQRGKKFAPRAVGASAGRPAAKSGHRGQGAPHGDRTPREDRAAPRADRGPRDDRTLRADRPRSDAPLRADRPRGDRPAQGRGEGGYQGKPGGAPFRGRSGSGGRGKPQTQRSQG